MFKNPSTNYAEILFGKNHVVRGLYAELTNGLEPFHTLLSCGAEGFCQTAISTDLIRREAAEGSSVKNFFLVHTPIKRVKMIIIYSLCVAVAFLIGYALVWICTGVVMSLISKKFQIEHNEEDFMNCNDKNLNTEKTT